MKISDLEISTTHLGNKYQSSATWDTPA